MSELEETNPTYIELVELVRAILIKNKALSPEKTVSSSRIIEQLGSFTEKLAANSIRNYLSHAANYDNNSYIYSAGRARGYYYSDFAKNAAEELNKLEVEEELEERQSRTARIFRENALYFVLREWLKSQGFKSKIIASLNVGAAWSNPDVVGILPTSHLDMTDIEIVTIEAKININNWKRDIFEAISHKRLANRVYFAYPITESMNKLPPDLRRYCEIYRVGLITIDISEEEMKALINAKNDAGLPKIIEIGNVDDRIPAPYDFLPPRFQIDFLKQIGINDKNQLWNFGADE